MDDDSIRRRGVEVSESRWFRARGVAKNEDEEKRSIKELTEWRLRGRQKEGDGGVEKSSQRNG